MITYQAKYYRRPRVRGWDDQSLADFDERWLRGDTIYSMAKAFNITAQWVCVIRRRRNLPTRRSVDGQYHGGNRGIKRR